MKFDAVVIGGGITGLGIALGLARAGQKVQLIEERKLGAGTSANSHRIIHGGFRFLPKLKLGLATESAVCLSQLLNLYPEQVIPINCFLPLRDSGFKFTWPLSVGCQLYNHTVRRLALLKGKGVFSGAQVVGKDQLREPILESLSPLMRWSDGYLVDHFGLIRRLKEEFQSFSGVVDEESRVISVRQMDRKQDGIVVRYESADLNGEIGERENLARLAFIAIGRSLSQASLELIDFSPFKELAPRWCQAVNLVFRSEKSIDFGLAGKLADGRLLFVGPRPEGFALGTAYWAEGETSKQDFEIERFLEQGAELFPQFDISQANLARVELGQLPIKDWLSEGQPAFLDETTFQVIDNALIHVIATKYTTFLSTADRAGKLGRRLLS